MKDACLPVGHDNLFRFARMLQQSKHNDTMWLMLFFICLLVIVVLMALILFLLHVALLSNLFFCARTLFLYFMPVCPYFRATGTQSKEKVRGKERKGSERRASTGFVQHQRSSTQQNRKQHANKQRQQKREQVQLT
ncbi:MAG: hypothetical protein J3R72DRAFT_159148 [Linnemannia gamsii]|nr:MAG: hypothetical protein J3R72DRAFT_159148 [Linnemannia gamsii]